MTVVFRRWAQRDVREVKDWYDAQRAGLGGAFADSVDTLINRLVRNPDAAPQIHDGVRRAHLARFPYSVFYVVDGDTLTVVGCVHQRRNPEQWPRQDA